MKRFKFTVYVDVHDEEALDRWVHGYWQGNLDRAPVGDKVKEAALYAKHPKTFDGIRVTTTQPEEVVE